MSSKTTPLKQLQQEQEQKALDKRKRTIAKLNHPHILKLTNSELTTDTRK